MDGVYEPGTPYSIRVHRTPSSPNQRCSITPSEGIVPNHDVTDIKIHCVNELVPIGVVNTGLYQPGLRVRLFDQREFEFAAHTDYFSFYVTPRTGVSLTLIGQPVNQPSCESIETIYVYDSNNIQPKSVLTIDCPVRARVGGEVQGLRGTGLVIATSYGPAPLKADSSFDAALKVGAPYSFEVQNQPSNPAQICTVTNGRGFVPQNDSFPVRVTCN
jgi:hypothetical protein